MGQGPMTEPDDGGQAFPTPETDARYGSPGMMLRDYFAGQHLVGAVARERVFSPTGVEPARRNLAKDAYAMADAMIAERDK